MNRFAFAVLVTAVSATATLAQSVAYSNIPSTLAGNYASLGYQATQTAEFGDRISFGGTDRHMWNATVTMSSWARSEDYGNAVSFNHPLTFNIYAAGSGNLPGALLGSVTQTFAIPYRPAGWGYNGIAFNATFDLSGLNLTAPDDIVFGLAYNTQSYGAAPTGVTGPYNSLNFALNNAPAGGVTVGVNGDLDDTMWNTSTAAWYTDGGTAGVGIFRRDTGWIGLTPMVEFFNVPTPGAAALLGVAGLAATRRRR